MFRNCTYRVSLFVFVLALFLPVLGEAEEQNDGAVNAPATTEPEETTVKTEYLPYLIPDTTTQILLAIIALLLFCILCALVWNIRFFATKKGEKPMSFDNVPLNESCVDDEILEAVPEEQDSNVISKPEAAENDTASSTDSLSQEILQFIGQLSKDFETKLKYDASKQELIDKLYKENMEFKEGIIKKFQQAMITAVIERIDDAAKDIAIFENREYSEENYRKLLASYIDITAGFQDMLSVKFDVECYGCEPLTRFDPKTQRSLKTCPTADADKNKLVKQTLRPGYKNADGVVLRPALVEVFMFEKNSENLIPPVSDLT